MKKCLLVSIIILCALIEINCVLACSQSQLNELWGSTGPDLHPPFNFQLLHLKVTDNCDCKATMHLNINPNKDKLNYNISNFFSFCPPVLKSEFLRVSDSEICSDSLPVEIEFWDDDDTNAGDIWPHGEDERGMSIVGRNAFGVIVEASIDINLTFCVEDGDTFSFRTSGSAVGRDSVSSIIVHEIGHCIGMIHRPEQSDVMYEYYMGIQTFSNTEVEDITCVYDNTLKNYCDSGDSPAFFRSVRFEPAEGTYYPLYLIVETLLEENVSELVISRAPRELGDWPTDDMYSEIGRINLEFPNGGHYSFLDTYGESGDHYLLEVMGVNGQIDNTTYIRYGETPHLDYPPGAVDEMRSNSLSEMHFQKWKSIFSGERGVQTITSPIAPSCNYLVIAFEDFVKDVTPICDYWDWSGLDVELVSCNGEYHSAEQIRDYIARTFAHGDLEAVWLVGSPDPAGYGVDLVPTFSYEQDLDFLYSDLDLDGLMDISVGRLPAQATREVVFYINKEIRYHVETTWGGRKDPDIYSRHLVYAVPDQYASGSYSSWNADQDMVCDTAVACYEGMDYQTCWENLKYVEASELDEWNDGDNASYRNAIKNSIEQELQFGRHIVFGLSIHSSSYDLLGAVSGTKWQSGVSLPGESLIRPCETFWIIPECYSNDITCNVRLLEGEPDVLTSWSIPVYELFMNRALLMFGSSGRARHVVTQDVARRISEKILMEYGSYPMARAKSIGDIWMDVYNDLKTESVVTPPGLKRYSIFGDPMLFVRGVYDESSAAFGDGLQFTVLESPNPFNGRIQFNISGLKSGGGDLTLYDLRGRVVYKLDLPKQAGPTRIVWDAKDNAGRGVASGTYFAIVTNQGREISKKISYIK